MSWLDKAVDYYNVNRKAANIIANKVADFTRSSRGSKRRYKQSKGWTSARKKMRGNTLMSGYVNDQYMQARSMYRKKRGKRLPFKTRRRLKRFRRKVKKIIYGRSPLSTAYRVQTSTATVGGTASGTTITKAAGSQLVLGDHLSWGCWIPTGVDPLDVGRTCTDMAEWNTVYNGAIRPNVAGRKAIKSAFITKYEHKLEIAGGPTDKSVLVDIYTFVAAQDIVDPLFGTPRAAMDYLFSIDENNGATGFASTNKGVTPFSCPNLGKYWKMELRERVLIPPRGTGSADVCGVTRQFIMKSHKGIYSAARGEGKLAIKGKTRYWMLIIDPYIDITHSTTDVLLYIRTSKMIHWRYMEDGGVGFEGSNKYETYAAPTV